uniref:Peptidase M14 domain-containing protein n=1 Tax=Glossina palpalis gambiensis TaxID=67801 RepID=A0A1B0C644_9MUSC
MLPQKILICLITIYHLLLADNLKGYQGYNKYTITYDDEETFRYLLDLQENDTNVNFWSLESNMSIAVIKPARQQMFEEYLNGLNAKFKSRALLDEIASLNFSTPAESNTDNVEFEKFRSKRQARGFFAHYPRYKEILNYMSILATRYPQNCRYESLGRSFEGRHIAALSIYRNNRIRDRRVVYIQGGAHGREWIAPLTVLYLANEILGNLKTFERYLKDVEIYLVPLVNPDGYEYSHTSDRFWRKNRRQYPGRSCVGVDINRNFANNWNRRGASSNLCSEVFAGIAPASESETSAVVRYLEHNRNRVKLSIDVHSYGKFIFYPYGYSRTAYADTRNFLHGVATRAASQIAKYRGTLYRVGTSANILYEASGGLDDFAYGNLGIPMSFTLELPGENFHVPITDIPDVCKETFAGFIELIRHATLF